VSYALPFLLFVADFCLLLIVIDFYCLLRQGRDMREEEREKVLLPLLSLSSSQLDIAANSNPVLPNR
jgi:hypothetical protein